jgi:hypothetical protein
LALVNFEMTLGYDNNNRTSVNNQKKWEGHRRQ